MLESTLGPGKVRAEASVRMNFDRIHETQERYDPDGQVTRSTQSVDTNSKIHRGEQHRIGAEQPAECRRRDQSHRLADRPASEETTNYEISKTVRTLIHEQPQIDRISLAVMVDDADTVTPDHRHLHQPRSPQELDRIAALVKSAIGFDAKRGDQVEVESMRFAADEQATAPGPSGLFGFRLEKADLMHLAQTGLFGLVALLALLLVLRPMVTRLTSLAPGAGMLGLPPGVAQAALAGPAGAALGPGNAVAAALSRGGGPALPMLEDESMVNIAQIEGQMRASSLRRLTELVEKHPEETLSIMRGWMAQENG